MINASVLLNETEYIEIKGKKFPLVQPKFIDYVKYASLDFSYKEEIHETEEQPYFENMVYLYDFFKIPENYADIEDCYYMCFDEKSLNNINKISQQIIIHYLGSK